MPQNLDVFYEQLYARKKTVKEYGIQAAIFVGTVLLSMASFMLCVSFIANYGLILGTVAIACIVFGGYKLFMKTDIEFEYIYLNGELDVDKIISKSERTRLVTFKAQNLEQFGEYNAENKPKVDSHPVDKRIDVRSNKENTLYYAIFNHKEYHKTLLIFEPEERILADLKKRIPRFI